MMAMSLQSSATVLAEPAMQSQTAPSSIQQVQLQTQHQQPNNNSNQNATAPAPFQPKPLRAMLARGAACDLCRSRKVKCDGQHPVCSQCKKSARGDASLINCVYEGGAAARAASSGASRKRAPGANSAHSNANSAPHPAHTQQAQYPQLPKLPPMLPRREEPQQLGYAAEVMLSAADQLAHESFKRDRVDEDDDLGQPPMKRQPLPPINTQPQPQVEQLVNRITELERKLAHQQQEAQRPPVHIHVRAAPSPTYYTGGPYSQPIDRVRSRSSFSALDERGPDIAAAWTPESNIRQTFDGPDPGLPPPAGFAPGGYGVGIGEPPAQTVAWGLHAQGAAYGHATGAYSGSSYPPLDYPARRASLTASLDEADKAKATEPTGPGSSSSTSFLDGAGVTPNSSLAEGDSPKESKVAQAAPPPPPAAAE